MSPGAYRLLFWLGLALLVVFALGLVQSILLPFAVGFAIAYVLAPAVTRLEGWGVRRGFASALVLVLFLVGLACLLVLLVPLIEGQVVQLIERMPALVRVLQDQIGNLLLLLQERLPAEDVGKLRDHLGAKLGEVLVWFVGLLQGMITSSIAILNIVSLVVVTPIVTFFLLRDWGLMIAHIDANLPRHSLDTVRGQARLVSDTLAGFVHGQSLVCLFLAVYYGVALTLAGVPSGIAIGLLIGVLAIIPIVGAALGFVLAVGLAAAQFGRWTEIFMVVGIFVFGQLIEGNILTPKLVGDRIHLHPVWVIFALFAGGTLFGFVGLLVAVPAAAVIGVLTRFGLARYRGSAIFDARSPEPPVSESSPSHRA